MNQRTENQTDVDMKDILKEQVENGSHIKVIEIGATTQDTVDALQALLPEDQKHKVSLVVDLCG